MLRLWLIAFCVVACGLSACSVDRDNTPPVHERAQVAKDRDEQAVLAALRELDPCALLDPAAAGWTGAAPVYKGPHSCEVSPGSIATVAVGSRFDADVKLDNFVQRPIDGAKAYVSRRAPGSGDCVVHLPVSFAYSIRFETAGADACDAAIAFATAAIAKLAEPDALTADLPLAAWDMCALLTDALAAAVDDPDNYTVGYADDRTGLDECRARELDELVATLDLVVSYDVYPDSPDGKKTIGGKEVWEYDGRGCAVSWANGTVDSGDPRRTDQVVELSDYWTDCELIESVAAQVIRLMAEPQPEAVEPQRPLLYRADEPDLPVAGACAYVTDDPATCEPYVEVEVPQGEEAIVHASDLDSNVACAVALDAVREHYGRGLRPVTDPSTDPGRCRFVQQDRAVEVEVTIRSDRVDEEEGAEPIEVAGRAGWLLGLSYEAYQGQVALGDHGSIAFWVSGDRTTDKVEPMLADILGKHFA